MSKILIKVASSGASSNLVGVLRQTTGSSISDISGAIKNNSVLKSYVLYGNNHDEVEYELLRAGLSSIFIPSPSNKKHRLVIKTNRCFLFVGTF
jgi:hypothetical protein